MSELQTDGTLNWLVQGLWALVVAFGTWMGKNAIKIWTEYLDRKRDAEKVDYERARTDLITQMQRLENFLTERKVENEALRVQMRQQEDIHLQEAKARDEHYKQIFQSYADVKAELAVMKRQLEKKQDS